MRVPTRHQSRCMVCGPANPDSWDADLWMDEEGHAHSRVVFDARHEGAPGVVHGGAVAAVLDDTLGSVPLAMRTPAVTVNLSVNYRAGVRLGREMHTEAWCERVDGRKLYLAARMTEGPAVVAEATALFLVVPPGHFAPEADGLDWVSPPDPA